MLIKSFNHFLNFLVFIICIYATPFSKRQSKSTIQYFFSFGDSYNSIGFDIILTKLSVSNPFGNPPYPGTTSDKGANWIGVLIESLAPNSTLSYNFASTGTTVNEILVPQSDLTPEQESTIRYFPDQTTQFSQYLASKPSSAPWTSADSVFAIWFGINDVGLTFDKNNQDTIHNEILTSYFNKVDIMYKAGGRNFVFLTVPPINRTPLTIAKGISTASQEATQIKAFNTTLSSKISSWASSLSEVKTWIYDTTTPFNQMLNNPTAYDAPNTTCFNADGVSCL